MSSAAPIAAMRFSDAIRLLKKQRRAGVKRVLPQTVDARRSVCAGPCRLVAAALGAPGAVAPLTGSRQTRYKTPMRRGRSTRLRWGAVVALALLALATAPHFHDEAEARDNTCVLCHVQGSPPVTSSAHENPAPAAGGSPHAHARGYARVAEVEGHGSRAPPA